MTGFPREVWDPVSIKPIPFLADMRSAVVDGPQPPRRTPKWRFSLAEDLAIQIQPKDSARLLFDCIALESSGEARITKEAFASRTARGRGIIRMNFWILKEDEGSWIFKLKLLCLAGGLALKDRVLGTLIPELFQDKIVLFSENCMICGRGLTDPVSRARLIGPECAGRTDLVVPLRLTLRQLGSNGLDAAQPQLSK